MRANAGLILLLGLGLIIGPVSAVFADSLTLATGNQWPVANGTDTAVITATATNISSGGAPVPLATVSFTVTDSSYGSLDTATATTDSLGKATVTFKTKTKSGIVPISATASSTDVDGSIHSASAILDQNIDHDIAAGAAFNNPTELPVGSNVSLIVTVTDAHGNLVDSNNTAEEHKFKLYMADAEGRGFWDGAGYTLNTTVPDLKTDTSGQGTVDLRIANKTGRNMIFMQKIGSMPHNPETWIDGVALQDPAYMVIDAPVPFQAIANGVDYFKLNYHLYDALMNPINGTLVYINSSDGMFINKYSVDGLVYLEYGPKTEAQTNTISLNTSNTSIMCLPSGTTGTCTQSVMFVNGGPVDIVLTGVPSSLISQDQSTGTKEGLVRAVVVDAFGNPVNNETVTFSLVIDTAPPYRIIDGGPYNESAPPKLSASRTVPDVYTNTTSGGAASAFFSSGGFVTSGPNFSASASGNATVFATWNGTTRSTRFSWKNYPVLSVNLNCEEVCTGAHVGDTINMGMRVVGDGAALAPNPVDAMLCMDSSGSMAWNINPSPYKSKMYYTKEAGKTFVDQMNPSTDSIGLAYFNGSSGIQHVMAQDFTSVKDSIQYGLNPSGSTDTRQGLKKSIDNLKGYSYNPKAVKAVILLTDGAYNNNGDPLARNLTGKRTSTFGGNDGDWRWYYFSDLTDPEQDLSYYASKNNIRIYTITLGNDANIQPGFVPTSPNYQVYETMDVLAANTGGFHRHVTDGTLLADIYKEIAGDLITKAGGDAEMKLDFASARDGYGAGLNISEYMEYVYSPGDSSFVRMQNATMTIFEYTQDDTPNWTTKYLDPLMYFKAGDLNLGDEWSVNYKVKLLKSGNIRLFGTDDSSSSVCFKDVKTNGTICTPVQECVCSILQDTGGGFSEEKVQIINNEVTNTGPDPKIVTVKWTTEYTGKYVCDQTLSYLMPGKGWVSAYTTSDKEDPPGSHHVIADHKFDIDTSSWPAGTYKFKVYATSGKASDNKIMEWEKKESGGTVFIQLN